MFFVSNLLDNYQKHIKLHFYIKKTYKLLVGELCPH